MVLLYIYSLSDNTLLKVLCTHTRANEIRHLAVSPNFQAIDELKFHMDLYWYYSSNDDLSPSTFSGQWVGHPAGHLESSYTASSI